MPDCTLPLRSSRPIQSEVINQISMRPNQRWARFPTRLMRQEEMGGSPSQELPERSAALLVQPWPLYAHGGAESLHCFIHSQTTHILYIIHTALRIKTHTFIPLSAHPNYSTPHAHQSPFLQPTHIKHTLTSITTYKTKLTHQFKVKKNDGA